MAKLYTAKIYDSSRIRKAMPDAVQICIQRRPWQWIRNDAEVIRFPALGPPMDLHREARAFLAQVKDIGASSAEIVNFQTRYAARYLSYITLEGDTTGQNISEIILEIQRFLIGATKDVVLECSCDAGKFCHRLLLYHYLIRWLGEEYAGGELRLKERKQ